MMADNSYRIRRTEEPSPALTTLGQEVQRLSAKLSAEVVSAFGAWVAAFTLAYRTFPEVKMGPGDWWFRYAGTSKLLPEWWTEEMAQAAVDEYDLPDHVRQEPALWEYRVELDRCAVRCGWWPVRVTAPTADSGQDESE